MIRIEYCFSYAIIVQLLSYFKKWQSCDTFKKWKAEKKDVKALYHSPLI